MTNSAWNSTGQSRGRTRSIRGRSSCCPWWNPCSPCHAGTCRPVPKLDSRPELWRWSAAMGIKRYQKL